MWIFYFWCITYTVIALTELRTLWLDKNTGFIRRFGFNGTLGLMNKVTGVAFTILSILDSLDWWVFLLLIGMLAMEAWIGEMLFRKRISQNNTVN
jgi:hypothetical protein